MGSRLNNFWLGALFSTLALTASVTGYWVQQRSMPVQSMVVDVISPVKAGGKLLVHWQVYRERACSSTKHQLMLDVGGVLWIILDEDFPMPPGDMGFDNYVTQTHLPRNMPPGKATMRVVISYVCNPIHLVWPIVSVIPDIHFVIEPGDPDVQGRQ